MLKIGGGGGQVKFYLYRKSLSHAVGGGHNTFCLYRSLKFYPY